MSTAFGISYESVTNLLTKFRPGKEWVFIRYQIYIATANFCNSNVLLTVYIARYTKRHAS